MQFLKCAFGKSPFEMQGLSVQDVYALNSLLNAKDSQTFQQISASFRKTFPSKDWLKLGLGLMILIKETDLTSDPGQRLVAVFLLYDMYSGNGLTVNDNPFLAVLLKLMNEQLRTDDQLFVGDLPSLSVEERYFLGQILLGSGRELLTKTPAQIVGLGFPVYPLANLIHLENRVLQMQSRFPSSAKMSSTNIFRFPDLDAGKHLAYSEQQATLRTCESLLSGNAPVFEKSLPPDFLRLAPPLHQGENEFIFLHSTELSRFVPIWADFVENNEQSAGAKSDSTISKETSTAASSPTSSRPTSPDKDGPSVSAEGSGLLEKALFGPMQLTESNRLIELLKLDRNVVKLSAITPEKLPKLVEDNPMVAVQVLFNLIPADEISDLSYFKALVDMELSVHGMEVVNRLTSIVELPEAFLNFYVSHCIKSCEDIKSNPFSQNRLVRMVCVFLSSLIRNRLINVKDLYIELQAFCVSFTNVKEASALFQTVQMVLRDDKNDEPLNSS